jgi:hypothetical protein
MRPLSATACDSCADRVTILRWNSHASWTATPTRHFGSRLVTFRRGRHCWSTLRSCAARRRGVRCSMRGSRSRASRSGAPTRSTRPRGCSPRSSPPPSLRSRATTAGSRRARRACHRITRLRFARVSRRSHTRAIRSTRSARRSCSISKPTCKRPTCPRCSPRPCSCARRTPTPTRASRWRIGRSEPSRPWPMRRQSCAHGKSAPWR